jgi:hypothetical protein
MMVASATLSPILGSRISICDMALAASGNVDRRRGEVIRPEGTSRSRIGFRSSGGR